eukprot:ctg_536.g274
MSGSPGEVGARCVPLLVVRGGGDGGGRGSSGWRRHERVGAASGGERVPTQTGVGGARRAGAGVPLGRGAFSDFGASVERLGQCGEHGAGVCCRRASAVPLPVSGGGGVVQAEERDSIACGRCIGGVEDSFIWVAGNVLLCAVSLSWRADASPHLVAGGGDDFGDDPASKLDSSPTAASRAVPESHQDGAGGAQSHSAAARRDRCTECPVTPNGTTPAAPPAASETPGRRCRVTGTDWATLRARTRHRTPRSARSAAAATPPAASATPPADRPSLRRTTTAHRTWTGCPPKWTRYNWKWPGTWPASVATWPKQLQRLARSDPGQG